MTENNPYRSLAQEQDSVSTLAPLPGRLRLYQWFLCSRYTFVRELGLLGLQAQALEIDTSAESISSLFLRLISHDEREGAAILLWRVQVSWAQRVLACDPPCDTPCVAPVLTRGLRGVREQNLAARCTGLLAEEPMVLRWVATLVLSVYPQASATFTLCGMLQQRPRELRSDEDVAIFAVLLEALRAARSPEVCVTLAGARVLRHDFLIEQVLRLVAEQERAQAVSWFEESLDAQDNHPRIQAEAERWLTEEIAQNPERFLTSESNKVRALVLQQVTQRPSLVADDALLNILQGSPPTSATPMIIEALLARRGYRAFALLCGWLSATRDDTQTAALADALRCFGERLALPALYEAYQRVEMPLIQPPSHPGESQEARSYFREMSQRIAESRAHAQERIAAAIQALRA